MLGRRYASDRVPFTLAVEAGHAMRTVALSGGGPLRHRLLDSLDVTCIQHHVERCNGFRQPVAAARADQRHDVIALSGHPCDGETPLPCATSRSDCRAAVAGQGLIGTFQDFLAPHLRSGALESVLEDWLPPFSGPFLCYHSRRHMPGPLRAFVDFIKCRPRA